MTSKPRTFLSNPATRRQMLRMMAAGGATLLVPGVARAAKQTSVMDTLARRRVLRNTDREGNTLAALEAIGSFEPILSYDTAYNLELAIQDYEQIVAQGGWKEMPRSIYKLQSGVKRNTVSVLKKRMVAGGDLSPDASMKDWFDADLDAAVRRFQARHGLLVSGKIDADTFFMLNVPAEARLGQLRLNALRVEGLAGSLAERYVVVNIPAAAIEAVEGGTVVQRHVAVVGRVDRPTPILQSKISEINFNPYWHVPKSIIQRDLIKYMNEDPEYLTKYRIRIYNGAGTELNPTDIDWSTNEAVQYLFRQEPGAENSMGHVKINFYNPHNVYLHDTPTKSLFAETARFHSSGCVRVEGVDELVTWLLTSNGGWDLSAVEAMFNTNERLDVRITRPVPILTTYITAWANRKGTVSFRDDIYDFDSKGLVTLS